MSNTKKDSSKKRKKNDDDEGEDAIGQGDDKDEEGSSSSSSSAKSGGKEVIILLDLATLEIVKTKKGDFQLLNCDDHVSLMRKHNKNPANFRPDIIHQELMAVLDSPLNKAGKVKVYVHTEKNVLIEVNPKTRIPRTFKRFSGLMVQLLHRLKIRSADGRDMLLKVVKNPISRHLPAGAHVYGFSHKGSLWNPTTLATSMPDDAPIVLIFGAMATGAISMIDHPYIETLASISEYPLSGVVAINRVLGAIENNWGIV